MAPKSKPVRACQNCKKRFDSDETPVFPVNHAGETWCPPCFHYVLAPRLHMNLGGQPVHCSRCRHETYATGVKKACAACYCPSVTILPRPVA